ncbi:MAG TPA: DUF5937 family protein [Candidatus Aquilonibacter sp.]|nr:DUF5937 family protein [Candidatus Aquilonibacter sp.]
MMLTDIRPSSVTFAFSPLQEVIRAMSVFCAPREHAEQMAWVRQARRKAGPALKNSIARWSFLLQPQPELFPDLLPSTENITFEREVTVLRSNPQSFSFAMLRRMMGTPLVRRADLTAAAEPDAMRSLMQRAAKRFPQHAALLQSFVRSQSKARHDFVNLAENFHAACLAHRWEEFSSKAHEDAQARSRLMKRFGLSDMLRTLTRQISVTGSARKASIRFLEQAAETPAIAFDAGATLTLMPSYFVWPKATFIVLRRETLDVRISYPIASPSEAGGTNQRYDMLARRYAALADPIRLRMLDMLKSRSLSTREFAGLLSLSEGGASRHLSILRGAGFITGKRDGYFVLYARTELADALDDDSKSGSRNAAT